MVLLKSPIGGYRDVVIDPNYYSQNSENVKGPALHYNLNHNVRNHVIGL